MGCQLVHILSSNVKIDLFWCILHHVEIKLDLFRCILHHDEVNLELLWCILYHLEVNIELFWCILDDGRSKFKRLVHIT